MRGNRGYNVCPVCEEAYDCGERHVCEGPPPPKAAVPRVDKHLEACLRARQYVQPGFRLGHKR